MEDLYVRQTQIKVGSSGEKVYAGYTALGHVVYWTWPRLVDLVARRKYRYQ